MRGARLLFLPSGNIVRRGVVPHSQFFASMIIERAINCEKAKKTIWERCSTFRCEGSIMEQDYVPSGTSCCCCLAPIEELRRFHSLWKEDSRAPVLVVFSILFCNKSEIMNIAIKDWWVHPPIDAIEWPCTTIREHSSKRYCLYQARKRDYGEALCVEDTS
jgi:hypothetical protein